MDSSGTSALARDEIRLLHLCPGARDSVICIEIRKATVDCLPPYTAVSYAWGDPIPAESLYCGQKKTKVAANLYGLLLNIRDEHSAGLYWIDALSINQSHLNEKSAQVQIMRHIYGRARNLLIWLGPTNEKTAIAFNTLHRLADSNYVGFYSDKQYIAVSDVLNRSWWSRIWVIQEVASFNADATDAGRGFVVCRLWKILWSDLVMSADNLLKKGENDGMLTTRLARECWRVSDLESLRKAAQTKNSNTSLELVQLIKRHRACQSSDPRDKIYALLGIAHQHHHKVTPDYHKRVNVLFWEITLAAIEGTKNLDILSYCQKRDSRALRSWVPDWSFSLSYPTILQNEDQASFEIEYAYEEKTAKFRATGDSKICARFSPDMTTLAAEGLNFDEVVRTTSTFPLGPPHYKSADGPAAIEALLVLAQLQETLTAGEHGKHPYKDIEGVQLALWNTVCAARSPWLNIEPEYQKRNECLHWFPPIRKGWIPQHKPELANIANAAARNWINGKYDLGKGPFPLDHYLDPFADYRKTHSIRPSLDMKYLYGRRLFVTKSGHIGLGPPRTQAGDNVAILLGGDVPFILRLNHKVPEKFELVSKCYVHGIMHWEVCNYGYKDRPPLQTFCII